MKPFVVVAFHYVEERLENFRKCLKILSDIPNIEIVITSNVRFDKSLPIIVSKLDDPYHLTWEHKKYMPLFLDTDYTHFAYIEGNVEVTKKTFDYWFKTRELFKDNRLNFIPAVHRIQTDADNNVYSLDCTHHQRNRPIVEVEGQKFISLSEPYQGMFIMDKEMVREHLTSDYCKTGQKGFWGIRESANLGNMYLNIPQGYEHRALVPLNNFSECWVKHFGTDYHKDPKSPHAKIRIEELFNGN